MPSAVGAPPQLAKWNAATAKVVAISRRRARTMTGFSLQTESFDCESGVTCSPLKYIGLKYLSELHNLCA
jgi:hypothetical protein